MSASASGTVVWAASIGLAVGLAACSGSSDFSGGANKSAPAPAAKSEDASAQSSLSPPKAAPETATAVAQSESPVGVQNTTPPGPIGNQTNTADGGPINIANSGFQCGPNMKSAEGTWSGTYSGGALLVLPVKGKVSFEFVYKDAKTMGMKHFVIEGGLFGGDSIKSISIDFDLHCGDLRLQDAVVKNGGLTVNVGLAMTGQAWNPPTLSGTWKGSTKGGLGKVASGTWVVKKN